MKGDGPLLFGPEFAILPLRERSPPMGYPLNLIVAGRILQMSRPSILVKNNMNYRTVSLFVI